jgi:hypothetical protein
MNSMKGLGRALRSKLFSPCPKKTDGVGASNARIELRTDCLTVGSWGRNYLSRRAGGLENSGKGFLNRSHD